MIRTTMGYPDRQSQVDILRERHHENPLDRLQGVVTCEELLELIESAKQVHIADAVYDYIVDLVDATRSSELVELGVSPRGALALCRMAKAHAFVRGGDFVTPEDVYQVFDDVCAHRLVLSAKARLGKITARKLRSSCGSRCRYRRWRSCEYRSFDRVAAGDGLRRGGVYPDAGRGRWRWRRGSCWCRWRAWRALLRRERPWRWR